MCSSWKLIYFVFVQAKQVEELIGKRRIERGLAIGHVLSLLKSPNERPQNIDDIFKKKNVMKKKSNYEFRSLLSSTFD